MKNDSVSFKNTTLSKVLFIISIVMFVYWISGRWIDIYKYDIVGAIFEILWIFMILGLLALPVVSMLLLMKEKFTFRSLHFYTSVIAAITLLLLFFG